MQPSALCRPVGATKFYAKLFANGRSQAVRLPREFRMAGTEVLISREGKKIILTPMPAPPLDANGWPIDFWKDLDLLSDGEDFPDPDPLPVGFDDVAVAASTSCKRGRT